MCARARARVGVRTQAYARERVVLLIQHATRRHIVVCGLSGSTTFFDIISEFQKKSTEYKMCVLISSTSFILHISHCKDNSLLLLLLLLLLLFINCKWVCTWWQWHYNTQYNTVHKKHKITHTQSKQYTTQNYKHNAQKDKHNTQNYKHNTQKDKHNTQKRDTVINMKTSSCKLQVTLIGF